MVLPEWIEHSTSPLPRGCSTTELRQQTIREVDPRAAETATRDPVRQGKRPAAALADARAWRIINSVTRTREERRNPQSAARAKRLAAALRENLRRRKEQARGRGSQSGGQGGD